MHAIRRPHVLPWLFLAGAAMAAPAQVVWAAGYSSFLLRPGSGSDQRLNGGFVGAEIPVRPAWSAEAVLSRQTGTEAGSVDLRQVELVVGPRYTLEVTPRWRGFGRILAGAARLSAWQGTASAHSDSLSLAPGVGAEVTLTRHWGARVQEEYVLTHYAGVYQHSACFSVGVTCR